MTSLEQVLYNELDSPASYAELKTIISKINIENPVSDILFKGKYQVLLLENLLPWQKPIGQFFQTVLAICGVKPKKFSSGNDDSQYEPSLSDEEDYGMPLPVVFDSLVSSDAISSSVPVIKQLKEKFYLYPLSQNVGRKLLMLCNDIADEFQIPYPVIVICHGQNPKAASIQGTLKNDKFVRVVVDTRGSISKQDQLPRLPFVKLRHLAGFVPSCTSVESSVYARYDVLGYQINSEVQPSKDMSVIIECYWSNPSAILEPISTDSTCFAKIKAVSGDEESGASNKFKEIKLLVALKESLNTGVMNWPDSSTADIMEKVKVFMKADTAALLKKQTTIPDVIGLESFDAFVKDTRTNLDFTDKLWLVLKDCSSAEELKNALIYVFDELNELVDPPFVHQKNASFIATNIKLMREKTITWPLLSSRLACEMLLEIGVEKLRKDYVALFVGLELAPYDSVNYFLQPELTSTEAVSCLQKLHTVLELTIIGLKSLCFPKLLLSEFVRNTLKYYITVPDIDLQHLFKFQIPSDKAQYLLDEMRPTIWELSLLSSDKDYRKQTVLHYSTTPTSEHIYAPKDYNPKLMLKNASYVFMTGTLVEDSFFKT